MNRIVPAIVAMMLLAPGVGTAQAPTLVRVAAASDLKFALDEVIRQFTVAHPSVRVEPVYGSSGNFHAQLRQRAPFDLFLSADVGYARDLVSRGVGEERDLFTYAAGRLVVWVANRSPLPIERDGLRALTGAKRIAIGNPRHAPYGRAAESALRTAGLWRQLEHRVVIGENIAQAAQFVQSGAADAGLIAKSLALAPAMRAAGRFQDVPADTYPELLQGGLVMPWAASRESTLRFREFLTGPRGRALLSAYGLGLPG